MRVRSTIAVCFLVASMAIFASAQQSTPAVTNYSLPKGYPPAARAVHAEGEVTVAVEVAKDGSVLDAKALSGHPLLRFVSEDAARRWRFATSSNESFLILRFVYKLQPRKGPVLEHGITGLYRVQFTDRFEPRIIATPSYESAHR